MTDRLSTLTRLRDMVRNADEPNRSDDNVLCWNLVNGWCFWVADWGENQDATPPPHLTGDAGAAELFVHEQLPGCEIETADGKRPAAHIKWEGLEAAAYGNTRPLAILDCLLSVLIEKEERE